VATQARVRLEDVARRAGVSKSIASRILNGTPGLAVRAETRGRVLEVARELDYRPHVAARSLRRAGTGVLGLLIPNLTMPVYASIVRGAVNRALERDVAVLVIEDECPERTEQTIARLLQSGRIDAVAMASVVEAHPLAELLQRRAVPHAFVNRARPGSGRNVTMDDARGGVAALDHLVALGHRRVGLVAGPPGNDPAERRALGFRRRAAELDLESAPVMADGDYTEVGGTELTRTLLAGDPALTAIAAAGFSQAVGALHAIWELGLRVPDDISVVSVDELAMAAYLRPPLTTVRMPLAELGAAAVDALVDQLHGEEPADWLVETEPTVLVRASTGPPPCP
jgi:LacI family transcriptional regulator